MDALRGLPYLAALGLAVLFAVAAVTKWRDPAGTARGFRALGVPRPWSAARVVPAVEAALAAGLVVVPAGMAVLALALLVAFTVFLAQRLRAGVTAACHCFGGGRDAALSWADVARNAWLVAAAALAASGTWPSRPTPAAVAVAAALAVLARASVTALRRRAAPPPGRP